MYVCMKTVSKECVCGGSYVVNEFEYVYVHVGIMYKWSRRVGVCVVVVEVTKYRFMCAW